MHLNETEVKNTHYEQALSQRYGITVIADRC